MALTTCPDCKGQVSPTAAHCPHCGHLTGNVWGTCPECQGAITPEQEFCKECGFPLRPSKNAPAPAPPAPPPPPPAKRGTTRRKFRP